MIIMHEWLTPLPNSRISQSLLRFLVILSISEKVLLALVGNLNVLVV